MAAVLFFFIRNSNLLPVPVECEQERNCAKLRPSDRVVGWHLPCELTLSARGKDWTLSASLLISFFICAEGFENSGSNYSLLLLTFIMFPNTM